MNSHDGVTPGVTWLSSATRHRKLPSLPSRASIGYRGIRRPLVACDTSITLRRTIAELDGDEFVAHKGRAEFESKVVKQFPFMDSNDHLAIVLLCEETDESCELRHMYFIHRLDRIVEDKAGNDRLDSEMEGEEKR